MCYNSCKYFKINNQTGTDRCTRGNNDCPDEIIECDVCQYKFSVDDVTQVGECWYCDECRQEYTEE